MIKTIRFLWDYYCYPIWAYDENHHYVDENEVEELKNHPELHQKFVNLQRRYDNLFINTPTCFAYIGFKTEAEKLKFLSDVQEAVSEFISLANGKYEIINDFDDEL